MKTAEEEIMDGFGEPNYNEGGFVKNHKLGEGDNIFRLIPPIKSCAATGTYRVRKGCHYGYGVPDRKNPKFVSPRPFACIEVKDWDTGLITSPCPEHDLIRKRQKALKDRTADLTAKQYTEAQIKDDELIQQHNGWLKAHNCSWGFYYNAMTQKGEFGLLRISSEAEKRLKKVIAEARADGYDPFHPDHGVWINFNRVGTGTDTDVVPTIVMETREDHSKIVKEAPLTAQQKRQALAQGSCADLNHCLRELTYKQILALTQSGGDPKVVEMVLSTELPAVQAQPSEEPTLRSRVAQVDPPAPPAPPAVKETPAPVDPDELAAQGLRAQLAELEAKRQAKKPVPASPAPKAPAAAPKGGNLTPEEEEVNFLATFGPKVGAGNPAQ